MRDDDRSTRRRRSDERTIRTTNTGMIAKEKHGDDDDYTFKVEKRKIEDFNGKTRGILQGSGMGEILTSREYADSHPNREPRRVLRNIGSNSETATMAVSSNRRKKRMACDRLFLREQ